MHHYDDAFSNFTMDPAEARSAAVYATAGLVGVLYFILAVLALHVLRPDINPLNGYISEYAIGPFGWLLTSAFIVLGLGSLALVVGLYQGLAPTNRSVAGLVLFCLWGICSVIVGIFPTDLPGASPTIMGTFHNIATLLSFPCTALGILLLSRRFKYDETWRSIYPTAWALAWVALVMLFVFLASSALGIAGLTQRIFVALVLAWEILTAVHLRSFARETLTLHR